MPYQLKNHIKLTHKTVRDFACHLCTRAFKSCQSLKRHLLTYHNEDRSFGCDGRLRMNAYIFACMSVCLSLYVCVCVFINVLYVCMFVNGFGLGWVVCWLYVGIHLLFILASGV